jgi:Tol biopolymer transport system component
VAFASQASNLVPGDTNGRADVFVYDRQTGTTVRVSVGTGGVQGNLGSFTPSLSADGRYVAFISRASNLVVGDMNGTGDIYRHDRDPDANGIFDEGNGVTIRVSVPSPTEVGLPSNKPSISADGRSVAYASQSATLVPGDTNGVFDVFVADLVAGTTVRASVDGAGGQGNGASDFPAISGNGQIVAFQSDATNLVAGDTNATSDAFVRDLGTGATIRVSVDTGGAEGNGASHLPAVSRTGHIVAFSSQASSLASGDTNGVEDVFVRQW